MIETQSDVIRETHFIEEHKSTMKENWGEVLI